MNVKSLATAIGLAISASATGAETGWSIDAGVAHTDNATLVNTDRISDTVAGLGAGVAWSHKGTRTNAALDVDGTWLHYLDNTYEDDFLGRANGGLTIQLLPERISWTFEDSYGQIATDPLAPSTPDSRQDVNVFSAGPDFNLGLSDQTRLTMSARYGDTSYEESREIDTRSWGGSVGVQRQMSRAASMGLFASQYRFDYDSPGVPHYDQQAGWASWQTQGARQSLSVDLGVNRVRRDGESNSSPLARVEWERRVRPSWIMNMQLGYEYQNTGQQFASGETINTGISNQPAVIRRADLMFTFEQPRTRFTVGGGLRSADYPGTALQDEKAWSLRMDFSRRFTPALQGLLGYRMDQRKYEAGLVRKVTLWTGSAGLDWRLGKSAFLTTGYLHNDSDGSPQNLYSSNLIYLQLSWRSGTAISRPRTFGY